MGTHYFYALALPKNAKKQMEQICGLLRKDLPFNRWVHSDDLHITLAFLGDAKEDKLSDSILRLEKEWNHRSFSLEIRHLGVFGKSDSPRILWAGHTPEPCLANIRDHVYSVCTDSGFKLETRPFKPHVTLARKWGGDFPFSRELLEQKDPFAASPLLFEAEKVVLYKTNMGKEPKYEEMKAFPLIGR
ncbi:hypothetical protein WQ57_09465 [Mesobacillus campisalis]|uniref:RNA 2',3'-cyclic phosphodiesterase n=1 Tax=Mesobacillus campisalis TaxID=1408103 RepID=A0A0M2SV14_9BACI|nr:RNA 2',3'-cyclic phosphodiesterase [Mesobacillus campisalis]KKK38404.1 hypothetical protein WQ57_09465 [Mesobacillus campisalis]